MPEPSPSKIRTARILRLLKKIVLWFIAGILFLFLLLVILIQVPAVQNYIKDKAVSTLSEKLKTRIEIGHISLKLNGGIKINHIFLADDKKDTLLYSESLSVNINPVPLFHKRVIFSSILLTGARFWYTVRDTSGSTNIDFITKAFADTSGKKKNTSEASSWKIELRGLSLNNIRFKMSNKADSSLMNLLIGRFNINLRRGDIQQMIFDVRNVNLENTNVALSTYKRTPVVIKEEATATAKKPLNLITSVNEIRLKNISFSQTDSVTGSKSVYFLKQATINPEKIDIPRQMVSIKTVVLKNGYMYMNNGKQPVTAKPESKNKKENSSKGVDFTLKKADIDFDSVHMVNNAIHRDSALGYLGNLSVASINIRLNSVQYNTAGWKGEIRNLQFRDNRTSKTTKLSAIASSGNRKIILEKLNLELGKSLINCSGDFDLSDTSKNNIPDFSFIAKTIRLYKADLSPYLPDSPSLKSFQLPDNILFTGKFSSRQQHVKGDGKFSSNLGSLSFNAGADHPTSKDKSSYNVRIDVNRLNAGKILKKDTIMGSITAKIKISGSGLDPKTMITKANIFVDSIFLMKRMYRSISMDGSAANGILNFVTKISDEVIRLNLALNGQFKNNLPQIRVKADIGHLDLHAMGFIPDTLTLSGYLSASYNKYSLTRFEVYADTAVITAVNPRTKITLKNKIDYYAGNDTVVGYINSNLGKFNYQGNVRAEKIPALLKEYLGRYYTLNPDTLSNTKDKYFNFQLAVNDLTPVKDLIPVNLAIPDGGAVTGQLQNNKLTADVRFQQLSLNTLKLDTFSLHVEGSDSALNMGLTAVAFQNPARTIRNLNVRNSLDNGLFQLRVSFSDADENPWFNFGVRARKEASGFRINMQEPMMMNFIAWQVPKDNEILFSKQGINFRNVAISYRDNELTIQNIRNNPDAVRIGFHNIGLSLFSLVMKNDSSSIAGKLNGDVSLLSLKAEKKKFAADLDLTGIRTGSYQLGNLKLTASNNVNPDRLDLLMKLMNQYMSLNAEGYYGMQPSQPSRINISANNLDLAGFATLLSPQLEELKGKINASILFTGTAGNPNMQGNIRFSDVGFYATATNTNFRINNQEIRFAGSRINFPEFRIQDNDGNPLTIAGDVVFSDLKNVSYQMRITSNNFLAYDAFYNKQLDKESKIILTSDMNITGDIRNPSVKATIKLDEGSKVYYEMANRGGNFSEEGIIEFVGNVKVPEEEEEQQSFMQKLMLTANITLNDGTPVTIMTDPAKGDILHVQTGGRLTLSQRPMQRPRMIGKIDISDGDYTMTLAGFKKTFNLEPKSSISWNGDIASPEFNLFAYYEIRTSPAPLFPQEAQTGMSQMPNALPFRVGLNLTGSMAKPEISFDLSLPEIYQNSYADVTTKLQQINSDPTEVNKQAMFLVLFGTFDISRFTDPSNLSLSTFSTMSNSGGTNALISRTLNQFAAQQIKFATLHFDLQSYDNLGGTTAQPTRTELDVNASRKFIDNRLDTRVGGNIVLQGDEQEQQKMWYEKVTPIFNFQYTFNKPRTWGVKIFRREDYRGILEGKVGSLGAGVIFQKDYHNLKDLFRKPPAGEGDKKTLAKE